MNRGGREVESGYITQEASVFYVRSCPQVDSNSPLPSLPYIPGSNSNALHHAALAGRDHCLLSVQQRSVTRCVLAGGGDDQLAILHCHCLGLEPSHIP